MNYRAETGVEPILFSSVNTERATCQTWHLGSHQRGYKQHSPQEKHAKWYGGLCSETRWMKTVFLEQHATKRLTYISHQLELLTTGMCSRFSRAFVTDMQSRAVTFSALNQHFLSNLVGTWTTYSREGRFFSGADDTMSAPSATEQCSDNEKIKNKNKNK